MSHNIKLNIRQALRHIIQSYPQREIKEKLHVNDLVSFIKIQELSRGSICGSSPDFCDGLLVRIPARDSKEAKTIRDCIRDNKNRLSVRDVVIDRQMLTDSSRVRHDDVGIELNSQEHVVASMDLLSSLKSALLVLNQDQIQRYFMSEDPNWREKDILLEYSSPNIAKPFHFGHLRSTLLGNYLSNLLSYMGHKVKRLNYIGDWGTQYGLLSVGMDRFEVNKDLTPLKQMVDIYVKSNEAAAQDPEFESEARRRLKAMEDRDDVSSIDHLSKWEQIRNISMNELKSSYRQLGFEFDVYDYESDQALRARNLVSDMMKDGLVNQDDDGLYVAEVLKNGRVFQRPLLKSDGTSLYLSRDLASAIDRLDKYRPEEMMYLAGADQESHFHSLKYLLNDLRRVNRVEKDTLIRHVKIGKVRGMSTRSGNFVLLSDILDEATARFREATMNTVTSKVKACDEELNQVSLALATASLFVYDMRMGRKTNYIFDWHRATRSDRSSGANIQTCYARLSSLLLKSKDAGITPISPESYDTELDIGAMQNTLAIDLIGLLNQLDTILYASYLTLDPSYLLRHSLSLCTSINKSRKDKSMRVIDECNISAARTRLTLFEAAHDQLEFTLRIIGLKPLKKT